MAGAPISGQLFPPPRPIEQPAKRDGPPLSGQIRATKSMSQLPTMGDEDHGCFGGIFKRRRGGADGAGNTNKTPATRPRTGNENKGPYVAKPGFDAPVSAVNTGDRHVMVECGESKRLFLVTPTTTPADIIKSAATCMAERIQPKSAVLLEYFGSVGVQRPLRRYEHIRDVMNSWDSDRQNSLLLVDPGTGNLEAELTIVGAPKVKPADESWSLAYSQKPGKWEKRYITLRSDGQVICQKDPEKPKDAFTICHMSDFDIYTPTPDKMRKKIKPPKKLCFAIKSQQKTTMFQSTNDFVHFFSTGDRVIGDHFYSAIQEWRSWYLVHVRGEGQQEQSKPAHMSVPREARSSSDQFRAGHRSKQSVESHYHLGTFRPAFETDQFDVTQHESGLANGIERRTSNARRPMLNKPVLADDEPLANLHRTTSVSKRQSLSEQRGADGRAPSNGSNEGVQRRLSTRQNGSNGDMKRSSSTREQTRGHGRSSSKDLDRSNSRYQSPRPLVDLTPAFKEPPQHVNKGRGYKPAAIGAGGLIESATTPEDPLNLPQQTVFRNTGSPPSPHNSGPVELKPQHSVHHSRKGRGYDSENMNSSGSGSPPDSSSRNKTAMPDSRRRAENTSDSQQAPRRQASVKRPTEAFTGEGLLGGISDSQGWGASNKGRGVIDGSRAGGRPLVDLTDNSTFTQGSLLNTVQKAPGIPAPIIDRERRDGERQGQGY